MKLMGIFTLFFIAIAIPTEAKIVELKTECGLTECYSIFSIDKDLSASLGNNIKVDTKAGLFPGGGFFTHEGQITEANIEITGKNEMMISGKIRPGTSNHWGFSYQGDISQVNSVWWNSSYGYRLNVSCSNMYDLHPIVINGSSGFMLGGQQQIAWSFCNGTGTAVYYNNYTDYVIANDNAQQPMEIEKGNGTNYKPKQVWDSDYVFVYHMPETSGMVIDSTINGHDLSVGGNVSQGVNAKIDGGDSFDKVTDYLNDSDSGLRAEINHTVEFWVNINAFTATGEQYYFCMGNAANYQQICILKSYKVANDWVIIDSIYGNDIYYEVPDTKNWVYLVKTYNGTPVLDGRKMYYNMTAATLDTDGTNTNHLNLPNPSPIVLGASLAKTTSMDGFLDEVRFSRTVRNTTYLTQTYNNARGLAGYGNLVTAPESAPVTAELNISFELPTPDNNLTKGFDYTPTLNISFQNNTVLVGINIEVNGINISVTDYGGYAELPLGVNASTKYTYIGYIQETGGLINKTETRTLLISGMTENELATRFTSGQLTLLLLLVLVGILIYAMSRAR